MKILNLNINERNEIAQLRNPNNREPANKLS